MIFNGVYKYLMSAAALLGVAVYVMYLQNRLNDLQKELKSVKQIAEQQSKLDQVVIDSTTKVSERDKDVSTRATQAVVSVRTAAGSETTVPAPVADSWRSAIIGLRDDSAPASAGKDP